MNRLSLFYGGRMMIENDTLDAATPRAIAEALPAETLDEAWAKVEALLPPGFRPFLRPLADGRYAAQALDPARRFHATLTGIAGPTPVAALQALAARIADRLAATPALSTEETL